MNLPFLPGISIRLIQHLVAEHYRVPVEAMTSATRRKVFAQPRQLAMGRIKGTAGKTGKAFDLPVAPPLARAIDAMPAVGLTTLLVTEYGKPFTAAGFGNWFKDQCVKAGLSRCTAHGLRKALARRAADGGVQQQGLKALGQWSGDREVAIYVAGANQTKLAESALEAVFAWEREANIG